MSVQHHTSEGHHPGPAKYVKIAAILCVITAIEVAVFYIPALAPVLTPVLLMLSAAKFAIVAMYYMHLKFDSRLYTGFFCAGLVIAGSIMIALLGLFGKFVGD